MRLAWVCLLIVAGWEIGVCLWMIFSGEQGRRMFWKRLSASFAHLRRRANNENESDRPTPTMRLTAQM